MIQIEWAKNGLSVAVDQEGLFVFEDAQYDEFKAAEFLRFMLAQIGMTGSKHDDKRVEVRVYNPQTGETLYED